MQLVLDKDPLRAHTIRVKLLNKGVKMTQLELNLNGNREAVRAEVAQMYVGAILRELEGGMRTSVCDSWEERCALTDKDKVVELLTDKRMGAVA